jgi:hypothetical protein
MIDVSAGYTPAITGTARRMHIRVPIRITAPGLEMGTLIPASGDLSDADGNFSSPQTVTQEFSGVTVLQNIVLTFANSYPVDLTVSVSSAGDVVYSQTITGNTDPRIEVTGFTVFYPDKITITATKWSAALEPMASPDVLPGYSATWTEDNLTELRVQMQADFSALSLPCGTAELTLDNTDGTFDPQALGSLFLSIEEGQPVPVELGVELADSSIEYIPVGTYFQHNGGWRQADSGLTVRWTLVDICGLLSDVNFVAPETLPETMGGWMSAILAHLGESFANRVVIDDVTAGMQMTATAEDVDGKSCGDILLWLCQACGVYPCADASTGNLRIKRVGNTGNLYDLDNLSSSPSRAINDKVGNIVFTLGEDETITVGGNSSFMAQTAKIDNPFIREKNRAIASAQNLLAAYGGTKISLAGRGNPSSEIGDRAALEVGKDRYVWGWIKSQSFEFSNGVMQNCKVELLQSDGFDFAYSATLTGSGVWFSPRGASSLRVILVGGGDYGATADGGVGGKIWFSTIPVNRGQRFDVVIGAGGTSSTAAGQTLFGAYTSDSGERYDPAYTDAISGLEFGKSNVPRPPFHSGDGGAQGVNGGAGTVILYWNLDPEWAEGEWYFAGDIYAGEAQA